MAPEWFCPECRQAVEEPAFTMAEFSPAYCPDCPTLVELSVRDQEPAEDADADEPDAEDAALTPGTPEYRAAVEAAGQLTLDALAGERKP